MNKTDERIGRIEMRDDPFDRDVAWLIAILRRHRAALRRIRATVFAADARSIAKDELEMEI